jgi:Flp pilus assembly protein TadG
MARNVTRRFRRRTIAAVEFALVLWLLLLVVLGVIEFGWAILKSQQITNAARQGARIGARVGATNADVEQAIQTMMDAANLGDSDFIVTLDPADVTQIPAGQQFMVTLQVPYANIGLGVLPVAWLPMPANLTARVTMAKE